MTAFRKADPKTQENCIFMLDQKTEAGCYRETRLDKNVGHSLLGINQGNSGKPVDSFLFGQPRYSAFPGYQAGSLWNEGRVTLEQGRSKNPFMSLLHTERWGRSEGTSCL